MDRQKIILFAVLLSIFSSSCKSEPSKDRNEPEKKVITENQASNNQDTTQVTKFVDDDEFVFGVIDNDLPISYFKSQFNLIEKQVIQNQHNPALSDTVMIFSNGKDTANFYVSPSNTILQEAVINSQEIVLNDSIKVGTDDEVLKRRFNLKSIPDSLVVKDFENSSYFLFTFQKSKIDRIVYKARYYD